MKKYLDPAQKGHLYFIGIGGVSMSGLAMICQRKGFSVSGSDAKESSATKALTDSGISVFIGQDGSHLTKDIDLVIYTAAIHPDNPEYQKAVSLSLPMITRAELLGEIMDAFSDSIGVSGTHGKTTTTAMLSAVLLAAGKDPTISIGGNVKELSGNVRIGNGDTFLCEACEYTNSFLSLSPKREIILNVEADHLDFFKDIEDIRHSFSLFAGKLPKDGILVINGDIDRLSDLTSGLSCRIKTFGKAVSCDYQAKDVSFDDFGCASFTVFHKDRQIPDYPVTLGVTGAHNVINALSVIAMAEDMEIEPATIRKALASCHGADRRFQKKGVYGGVTIIDDYAHHPQEIAATIKAARNLKAGSLWVIFQPHTYTRTKALLSEFADALSLADHVIVAKIYPARETDTLGMSAALLAEKVRERGCDAVSFDAFKEIQNFLIHNLTPGDLWITMGAGDIVSLGESILSENQG